MPIIKCGNPECGSDIETPQYKLLKFKFIYCDKKCHGKHKSLLGRELVICKYCGKKYEKKKSSINWSTFYHQSKYKMGFYLLNLYFLVKLGQIKGGVIDLFLYKKLIIIEVASNRNSIAILSLQGVVMNSFVRAMESCI